MMRFAHPEYLYYLAVIPLLLIALWYLRKKRTKALRAFASSPLLIKLADATSTRKQILKVSLILFVLIVLLLALANPQVGTRLEEVKQQGIDIFIALDVSSSMRAEDVKPNRLEKAKYEIGALINRLAGDRIGMIVFSGESYVQFPLTTDYAAANLLLDIIDFASVPNPGTAIGTVMAQVQKSFNDESNAQKVLVIITDGEDHEGDVISRAEDLARKGVLIYTIGMGSPAGAPIPLYGESGRQTDFKRDRAGNIILTKLDELALQRIAAAGNGKYYRATNALDELDEIYKDLSALQKQEYGVKQFTDYEDKFQYFLALAIVILILEIFLSDRKSLWMGRLNPFKSIE